MYSYIFQQRLPATAAPASSREFAHVLRARGVLGGAAEIQL